MPKRIALFILGIVLSIGTFLLYQYFTGASFTGHVKKTPIASGNPDPARVNKDMKYTFESSDESGRLLYRVEADSAEQLRDSNGRALPGQFIFKMPIVNFYQKDNRVLEIAADQCTLVLDQAVRANMGSPGGPASLLGGPTGTSTAPGDSDNKSSKLLAAVRIGELSGHVRLYLSPRPAPDLEPNAQAQAPALPPPTAAGDALKGELKIFFDKDLKFDRDAQLLTSAGKIFIRSDAAEFDGEGLELTLTTDSPDGNPLSKEGARRIEYLKILKGDTIIIHNGAKSLSVVEPATQPAKSIATPPPAQITLAPPAQSPAAATAAVAAATSQAATKPAKAPVFAAAVYKLDFGQNVHAFAGKTDTATALTSDKLHLIFTLSQDMSNSAKKNNATQETTQTATTPTNAAAAPTPTPAPSPASAAVPSNNAPAPKASVYIRAADDRPAPISERVDSDLIVTWNGPMEMRPAKPDDLQSIGGKLSDGSDILLEALGTATQPVTISDPARFRALAGRLWYHRAENRVALESGAFERVELQDLTQTLAADTVTSKEPRVILTSPGIDFYQEGAERRAVLMGPGTLVVKAPPADPAKPSPADGIPTTVAWKENMDVQLMLIPDPKHPGKNTLAIKNAAFRGAGVHTPTLDFSADLLQAALIATADPKQPMALQHLLATGHVIATSLQRNNKILSPNADTDGLRADAMEIKTAIPHGAIIPVASQLILTGHAAAWQYAAKNALTKTADTTGALQKESVSTNRLVADLQPKSKSTAPSDTLTTMGGMGAGVEVVHFTANENVTIEITPPPESKQSAILATTHLLDVSLDNVAKSALALLTAPADLPPVAITLGAGNSMHGRRIELLQTQNAETINIAGPGQFRFLLPPPKESPKAAPTPLEVAWQTAMSYDNHDKLAVFTGNPIAQIAGERPDLGKISAERRLVVQLKAAPTTQPKPNATTQPTDLFTANALDYIKAEGNVQAQGGQLSPDNTLLTQLRITAPDQLTYHYDSQRFDIPGPGFMVIDNNKPDKIDANNPAGLGTSGQSAFSWKGSFLYNGEAKTITFSKDVDFFFTPAKPFHIATGPANSPAQDIKTVRLHTENLVATLIKPPTTSPAKTINSPIGLGSGGQELKTVAADGGATLDAGDFKLKGATLHFDAPSHTAVATGAGDDPAVIIRPNQITWFADKITWDMTKDQNEIKMVNSRANIQGNGN